MLIKQNLLLCAVTAGAALVFIGCADGSRQNNKGKRMFRNPAYPSAGANGLNVTKPGGKDLKDVSRSGGGASLPTPSSESEKQILARFTELSKESTFTLTSGTYDLSLQVTHATLTTVAKGNASVISEVEILGKDFSQAKMLSSGTLNQSDDGRTIAVPMSLEFDAAGAATLKRSDYILESRVESKGGQPVLNDNPLPQSTVKPASFSIIDLLRAPDHTVKDASGKTAILRILPRSADQLILWVTIEELAVNKTGSQGDTFNRNFFFGFVKSATQK